MKIASGTVAWALAIAWAVGGAQHTVVGAPQAVPMPQDLVADSYAIYSLLLPGNQIEWGDAKRSFWLMEDTTKAEPADSPCATSGSMNPHRAIQAPEPRTAEFAEVLADFDAHCHDQYRLDAGLFHVGLPVRLMDDEAKKRYGSHVSGFMPPKNNIMQVPPTPDEFKGAAGMHRFTAVYFNHAHTLAITEIGMWCGLLCGNWRWVVLERTEQGWKVLPWATMITVS